MRWVGIIVGLLLCLTGAIWVLQGINILPGSFMTGHLFWAAAGVVALVVGVVLIMVAWPRPKAQ